MGTSSDDRSESHGIRVVGGGGRDNEGWSEQLKYDDSGQTVRREVGKATDTQQRDSDSPAKAYRDWIRPPYNPKQLASLTERSETHYACVSAKAQNVAGYGFDLVPHPTYADVDGNEKPPGKETVHEFWYSPATDWLLGPDRQPATPEAVLEHGWWDYEGIGWGVLEVLTNESNEPTGLAHIPAHSIRRRAKNPGYVQLDGPNQVGTFFGAAGDKYGDDQTFIDAETGDTRSSAGDVGTVANELIVIRNYSPLAPYYGVPDIVPALQTLEGDLAARQYNTAFFENDGVPRFVVLVEGGSLTERAWTNLEDKLRELTEQENTHRGIIIEAVNSVAGEYEDRHDVTLDIQPLTVGIEEDASFLEFRRENEHDLLQAHSVPPVIVGRTEDSNYANSKSQREEFAQSTIRPKQEDYAARLYNQIHRTMLGVEGWTIEFELHGGQNREREATIVKTRAEAMMGTMTVNELRQELDKEPLLDEDGEELPVGRMLVGEFQSGGGGRERGDLLNEDALDALIDAEREQARNEVAGYDLLARE